MPRIWPKQGNQKIQYPNNHLEAQAYERPLFEKTKMHGTTNMLIYQQSGVMVICKHLVAVSRSTGVMVLPRIIFC
jgi:hypothetical protein